jgi:hypothetical protein
VRTWFA